MDVDGGEVAGMSIVPYDNHRDVVLYVYFTLHPMPHSRVKLTFSNIDGMPTPSFCSIRRRSD